MFGKQFYKQSRVRDKVDVIVTDSPLLLSIYYNKSKILDHAFNELVYRCFNSFNNYNYFLHRVKPYNHSGRLQEEDEAKEIDVAIKKVLDVNDIPYQIFDGNRKGCIQIVEDYLGV